jgi:hypothetical protein
VGKLPIKAAIDMNLLTVANGREHAGDGHGRAQRLLQRSIRKHLFFPETSSVATQRKGVGRSSKDSDCEYGSVSWSINTLICWPAFKPAGRVRPCFKPTTIEF